ncbi:uncharacterized protein LOC102352962 isoform X3 [Latimeria chalumnae]|uniref:uncharacterized protein LOC102352962 isoform X3 n=1 Tax=Latimeria chalumnae TaxID=7897 RepID=UPI0006D8E918|nr:PREDICTED: uncharacterized protein LOC102352962 isoform X3 [Latimeria chalumnae]|eukprot:XP_014348615.1 PREDICTED: uncharacterized protein LOC102352962 isoform X3 [Latimeria chalumnae]
MSRGTSLALLALLLCAVIDSGEQRRCFCSRKISYVSVRQIKTLEIIHPSVDCDQMQIMIQDLFGSECENGKESFKTIGKEISN